MMYKKIIIIFFMCFFIFSSSITSAYSIEQNNNVLIVYDYKENFNGDLSFIDYLTEIIKHFKFNVSTIDINQYKSIDLNEYSHILAVLNYDSNLEDEFTKNIKNYCGKIFWIGRNIEQVISNNPNYNFKINKNIYDLKEINIKGYDNEIFYMDSKENITSIYSNKLNIQSSFFDGKEYIPFIVTEGKFWYESVIPKNKIMIYETINELMKFLEINYDKENAIIINISDVTKNTDSDNLFELAKVLEEEQVPYIVSVNTSNITESLRGVLKYAQSKGASISLRDNNEDIKGDVVDCLNSNIYPLCIINDSFYLNEKIKNNFSTIFQSESETDIFRLPYIIKYAEDKHIFIPNNSRNINAESKYWQKDIEKDLSELNIIKGFNYTINIASELNKDELKKVVTYAKNRNYKFIDIKKYDNWVNWDDVSIKSKNGKIEVSYDENIIVNNNEDLSYIQKINRALIVIVGMFTLIFLIVFLYFKNINKRKFLR